jgi:hypothetical protein
VNAERRRSVQCSVGSVQSGIVVGGVGGRGDVRKFEVSSFKFEAIAPSPSLKATGRTEN